MLGCQVRGSRFKRNWTSWVQFLFSCLRRVAYASGRHLICIPVIATLLVVADRPQWVPVIFMLLFHKSRMCCSGLFCVAFGFHIMFMCRIGQSKHWP
jgi:hypothetical protein